MTCAGSCKSGLDALGEQPGAIDPGEPRAADDAFGGDATVRALQMRPDRRFLRRWPGPKPMWQNSEDTGVCLPEASISAATPRPVPGPRMTRGPDAPSRSGPICRVQSSGMTGSDSACASKSLSSSPAPRLSFSATSRPSMCQVGVGEFQLAVDDRPGAAGDRRARPRREFRQNRRRSPRRGRDNRRCAHAPASAAALCGVSFSEKRALVPPMSQTRTGKAKLMAARFAGKRGAASSAARSFAPDAYRLALGRRIGTPGCRPLHLLRIFRRRRHGARRPRARPGAAFSPTISTR